MSQQPDSAETYRPLSGLAVAGFALALLFTLGMAAAAGVAFYSRLPLLLDLAWLLVPLLAAGLSLAGLIQIRKSEGTRVGMPLARWGLGLSGVVGLGYLAYYAATEEALRQQASTFADRWFELLQERRTYAAFWDTLEPAQRDLGPALTPQFLSDHPQARDRLEAFLQGHDELAFDRPEFLTLLDEQPALRGEIESYLDRRYFWGGLGRPGRLAMFQTDDLVTLIERWQGQARVEPQGIRSWSYLGSGRQGRYEVVLGYRLVTPEGTLDAVLAVHGSQLPDDPRRHWQVLMAESGIRSHLQPTPVGEAALTLSGASRHFIQDWFVELAGGSRLDAYLATRPPDQRPGEAGRYAASLFLGPAAGLAGLPPGLAGTATLADPEAARRLYLPGFADFADARLLDRAGLKADKSLGPDVVRHTRQFFAARPPGGFTLIDPPVYRIPAHWRIEAASILFEHPFLVRVPPRYVAEGTVVVESADPGWIAALAGQASAPAGMPAWRIKELRLRVAGIAGRE